jgi:hypothetical protein
MFSHRLKWLLAGMALAVSACAYGQSGYGQPYGQPYGQTYGQDYRYDDRTLIRCESQDERTRYCAADIRGDVRLVNQLSRSACVEGRSWGFDRRGIWVSRGCRAEFSVEDRNGYDDDYPGNSDYGRGRVIRCESNNSRTVYCAADTRDGVRLLTQHSRSACVEGRTWGWNSRGVWVSEGCRAQFQIGGRGYDDNGYGNGYGDSNNRRITCQSHDGRYNFCRIDGYVRQVQIHRQLSQSQCQYNYSWGYRSDGVWVDRGCRAEFVLY